MRDLALAWYGVLNALSIALKGPLAGLTGGTEATLLTAIILGLIGAVSPCQLSTNAASMAYVVGGPGQRGKGLAWSATAYVAGKVLVYSGIGLLAVLMGQGLQALAIPTFAATRRGLGPLMILIGLALLGLWRPRLGFGHGPSLWLRQRTGGGIFGSFLLGVAFAFAFCPTLALLFFGYVIPTAIAAPIGPLYPAAFALGTTFPLLLTVAVLLLGSDPDTLSRRLAAWEPRLRKAAGVIFLLAGLNDAALYWFI